MSHFLIYYKTRTKRPLDTPKKIIERREKRERRREGERKVEGERE